MEQSNASATPQRPTLLTVLCILSMIGNGLLALLGLIGIFASNWVMNLVAGKANEAIDQAATTNSVTIGDSTMTVSMDGADVQKAHEAASGFASMGKGILITAFVVLLLFGALKFFGALRMWGMKKGGFWLYLVPAALMTIGALISMQWVYGIVSLLFIVGYAMNLKAMK